MNESLTPPVALTPLGRLKEHAIAALQRAGFQLMELPEVFHQRSGKVGVELSSSWLAHPLGTQMKCAHLCGPRSEILNLMIYPNNADEVPIFAVEYIVFVAKPFVAVVDLQPAAGIESNLVLRVVEALQSQWREISTHLSPGGELPDWAHSHFTPTCIYTRPQKPEEMSHLEKAFHIYLGVWLERFFPMERAASSGHSDLVAYQQHHVQHTPGRTFLSKTFGSEWTEEYLKLFMYASANPNQKPSG